MSSGGFFDNMLDRIPGYGGYRDKERRRDTDRAIRDNLALEYGQLADRLAALARTLAEERQILAVGIADKPHKQLRAFIDRVRTASYGYAPLFSDTPVDAAALDQLAAFDRALADQREHLSSQIDAMERADPKSPEFKTLANDIGTTIQGLDDRFDKRGEVLTSGKASSEPDVLALLRPAAPTTAPLAFRLHEGEALTYRNVNYTIIGRVSIESSDGSWRAFQLRGGPTESWLVTSDDHSSQLHLTRQVEETIDHATGSVEFDGRTYTLAGKLTGTGEIIGQGGNAPKQPVQFTTFRSADGAHTLDVFAWGQRTLALAGDAVDTAEFDFFTREK